jgi:hypothetical protein
MTSALARDVARNIEWDCTQVLIRFFNCFDRFRYEEMADMFAPGGVWHRAGQALSSRAAVIDALGARSRTQVVRHVVTNILVDVVDRNTAETLLYITAYMHDTGTAPTAVPVIRMPYLLLTVPGRMVRVRDEWKILSMTMNRTFEFAFDLEPEIE